MPLKLKCNERVPIAESWQKPFHCLFPVPLSTMIMGFGKPQEVQRNLLVKKGNKNIYIGRKATSCGVKEGGNLLCDISGMGRIQPVGWIWPANWLDPVWGVQGVDQLLLPILFSGLNNFLSLC